MHFEKDVPMFAIHTKQQQLQQQFQIQQQQKNRHETINIM